jgi:hypothetical protein
MVSNDRETATNHTNYQSTIWVHYHVTSRANGNSAGECSVLDVNLDSKIPINVWESRISRASLIFPRKHSQTTTFSIRLFTKQCLYLYIRRCDVFFDR